MNTGEKVKLYLDENGLKQNWLSYVTGISEAKLSLTLTGKRIMKIEEIQLICGALNVGFDKFLEIRKPQTKTSTYKTG